MKLEKLFFVLLLVICSSSCSLLKQKSGIELPNGLYKNKNQQVVYVETLNDTIKIFNKNLIQNDYSQTSPLIFGINSSQKQVDYLQLQKSLLDFDFLTILF